MKQILTLVVLFAISIGVQAQVDDMYFVPKKKKVQQAEESSYGFETTQQRITLPAERDADEYNRRPGAGETSYYDENDEYESEEYGEEIDDTEYLYSSRIVRFHNPHRVIVSSPWYWDVVYTCGTDNWVIYDDGIYWEVYPTYTPWYYPTWSWNYGWGCHSPYLGVYGYWNHWYSPHYWWHNHHYGHFHHHWGGYYDNHFAAGGRFRDGRIPPITDLRTGNTIARGTNIERNNSVRRGELSGSLAQSGNRGSLGAQSRGNNRNGTTVERGTVSRRGETAGRTNNRGVIESDRQKRTTNRGISSERQNRTNRSTVNGANERKTNNRGTVRQSNDKERNYDRPSSTRNTSRSTSVDRSSSGSSRSYSSGGGFNRSSGGGVSRGGGGGSRGGGRR